MKPSAAITGLIVCLVPSLPATSQPAVVPTSEGQVGTTASLLDRNQGTTFEARGSDNDPILGTLATLPVPSGMSFLTDAIHDDPNPIFLGNRMGAFANVLTLTPRSARNGTGDVVAFAFVADGTASGTMGIKVTTFDATGAAMAHITLPDLMTFPDPNFNAVGVAADNQGVVTVTYSELPTPMSVRVTAARFDAVTGLPIGGTLPITDDGHAGADVALLDPAGNRLIIPSSEFSTIRGNILDTSGATPVILPEFPISTTPAIFANFNPNVGADPETGEFVVAWENLSGLQGDPVNIRARRFDVAGNPIGDDFLVNTTTANAQQQPSVAVGNGGLSAIAWSGDSGILRDELDVFLQVYDAQGNPIGGEIRANTTTADVQDRPTVRFLPEPDGQGRPQVAVVWRDVGEVDGSSPRGTGTSYKCFSIEGLEDPSAIFADGFESGDTSSWSDTRP